MLARGSRLERACRSSGPAPDTARDTPRTAQSSASSIRAARPATRPPSAAAGRGVIGRTAAPSSSSPMRQRLREREVDVRIVVLLAPFRAARAPTACAPDRAAARPPPRAASRARCPPSRGVERRGDRRAFAQHLAAPIRRARFLVAAARSRRPGSRPRSATRYWFCAIVADFLRRVGRAVGTAGNAAGTRRESASSPRRCRPPRTDRRRGFALRRIRRRARSARAAAARRGGCAASA